MPPPVPVDSTTGAEKLDLLANSSDTAWVYGKTVDEPTMRIWSRASAMAGAAMTRPVRAATASLLLITGVRSEEHTSELQSLMRISYAVFCLKKKKTTWRQTQTARDNTSNS